MLNSDVIQTNNDLRRPNFQFHSASISININYG